MKYVFLTFAFVLIFLTLISPTFYFPTSDFIYHFANSSKDFSNPDLYPRYERGFGNGQLDRFYIGNFLASPFSFSETTFSLFFLFLFIIIAIIFYYFERNYFLLLFMITTPIIANVYYASIYAQWFATFLGMLYLILYKNNHKFLSIIPLVFIPFSHRLGLELFLLLSLTPIFYQLYLRFESKISLTLTPLVYLSPQRNLIDSFLDPFFVLRIYVPHYLILIRKIDFYFIPALILLIASIWNYRIALTGIAFLCMTLSLNFDLYYKNSKFIPVLFILSFLVMIF